MGLLAKIKHGFGVDTLDRKLLKELGFGNHRFGRGTSTYYDYPHAVSFASDEGRLLQSLQEAFVYRVASGGVDGSNRAQHTCDLALYFDLGGVRKVAFVNGYDFVDTRKRSLISRCLDGFNANQRDKEWYLPYGEFCRDGASSDGAFCALLDEVVETGAGKVFDFSENALNLSNTRPSEAELKEGVLYSGNHPIMTFLLGSKVAKFYSDHVRKSQSSIDVKFISREPFTVIPAAKFICRPVILLDDNQILANHKFDNKCLGRGVVQVNENYSK